MSQTISSPSAFAEILEKASEQKVPVFLKFFGTFCPPCKQIAPLFNQLAKQNLQKGYFVSINVQELPEVAETFKVASIPAFVVIKNLKVVDSWKGANSALLTDKIKTYCVGR